MKRSSIKFLHRVRIHGGEFDASARAMHRDGMTSSFQAAVETVSIATIERKQMSTKTTFKRVALGTVAALGFGLLSVVPSQAVTSIDTLTLSSATASQTTAETYTATSAVATLTFAGATSDSMSVTASVTGNTSTELATPMLQLVETSSATISADNGATVSAKGAQIAVNDPLIAIAQSGTARTTAKFAVYLVTTDGKTAPTKPGVYTIKLTPANKTGGTLNATAQTLTITVTTDATLDTVATSATSVLTAGDTSTSASNIVAPTADDIVTGTKTASTTVPVATIKVTTKNASGTANAGESFTATISGSGTLGAGPMTETVGGNANAGVTASSIGRAITVKNGHFVQIFPDGTSGVGTVTISSALGVILATEKVTFFGTPTSIVTSVLSTVLATGANASALSTVVKDKDGTIVSDATLYVTSDALTKVSDSYKSTGGNTTGGCAFVSSTQTYECTLNGVAAGTANITVGTLSSATDTTAGAINGNKVAVRVGSTTAASIAWTLDKSSYSIGEKATLTATLLDSTGLPVAAGDYASIMKSGGLKASRELGASSDTLTATAILGVVDGVRTYTIYMPLTEGDLTLTGTTAGTAVTGTAPSALSGLLVANQAAAISIKTTVVSSSGTAATDAANEATDAANAATDAANAAAEAADAATAAAQDAADAVAALSTQVATLISALKAQITSLTNLVIKIQKKVKA